MAGLPVTTDPSKGKADLDSTGGPVAETLRSQCSGPRSDSWAGN